MALIELTNESFEKSLNEPGLPVVVKFGADWCPPCKMMDAVLEEIKKELKDEMKFAKINVEKERDLADEYQIGTLPTIIFFKEGKEVQRTEGFSDIKDLSSKLKKWIKE